MNLLHVINSIHPKTGGPAFALEGLASAQHRAGQAVQIFTTFRRPDRGIIQDRLEQLGVPITRIGPTRTPLCLHPRIRPALGDLVRQADLLHCHGLWESIYASAAALARRHRKPYLIRTCGMLDPWSLSQSAFRKRLMLAWSVRRDLNLASAIHVTSDMEKQSILKIGLRPPIIVEPNGVNLPGIDDPIPAGQSLREQYPSLGPGPIVLYLGRLHPKKGPDLLIEAMGQLCKDWPGDTPPPGLVLAGDGDPAYVQTLKDVADTLGLQSRCVFPGIVTGPRKMAALRTADLFALPSQQENFGISVAEALYAGLPVLVSPEVALGFYVTGHQAGKTVPRTAQAWSQALGEALRNPAWRQAASTHGRSAARQTFNWNQIAQRWSQRYVEAVAGTPHV